MLNTGFEFKAVLYSFFFFQLIIITIDIKNQLKKLLLVLDLIIKYKTCVATLMKELSTVRGMGYVTL